MILRPVLLVGGPDAGKSNYLFRTWLAIEAQNTPLVKDGLPGELEYLNSGAATLLGGRFAQHTSLNETASCAIPVATRGTSAVRATLVVPDVSGELWLNLYHKREWYSVWDEYLTPETGYVLFVRAGSDHVVPAMDWITCERLYGGQLPPAQAGALKDRTPTQVLLVEWLQILRSQLERRVSSPVRSRLSIVVSAWDAVPKDQRSSVPGTYLQRAFPLFAQFLEANLHGFEVGIFGVSVAEGDLKNDAAFRDRYLDRAPTDWGYVVYEEKNVVVRSSNVTLPIMWAMRA